MMLTVKVRTGSGEPIIKDNMIIIFTDAKRENGKANVDVISQIKKLYNTESVTIKRGKTSSRKLIFVGIDDP